MKSIHVFFKFRTRENHEGGRNVTEPLWIVILVADNLNYRSEIPVKTKQLTEPTARRGDVEKNMAGLICSEQIQLAISFVFEATNSVNTPARQVILA